MVKNVTFGEIFEGRRDQYTAIPGLCCLMMKKGKCTGDGSGAGK